MNTLNILVSLLTDCLFSVAYWPIAHCKKPTTSRVIGFIGSMRFLITLNSIHNNHNIAWDNEAYSLITETRSLA